MSKRFDISVYKRILSVRSAYAFDIGGFLMRVYMFMQAIGTVTMLTLSGHSFVIAGTVSSTIALATFLIGPRVSKLVDERGQHKVVPVATAITLVGLVLMIGTVQLSLPFWLFYPAALLMGFLPSSQSLTRTRWTYMIHTGKLGENAPDLKAVFSYEGILDDISFMVSPATSIALAGALFPSAGMIFGGICCVVGAVVLCLTRSTEPEPGWVNTEDDVAPNQVEQDPMEKKRLVIFTSSIVRIVCIMMLFQGLFFSVFDTAIVSFAEEIGSPGSAGLVLASSSVASIIVGFIFGMTKIKARMSSQLFAAALLFGLSYTFVFLPESIPGLMVVFALASITFAPFIIVSNSAVERDVPGSRLTEAITWINASTVLGMAAGPTVVGFIIERFGGLAGLDFAGAMAFIVAIVALACLPLMRKHLDRA